MPTEPTVRKYALKKPTAEPSGSMVDAAKAARSTAKELVETIDRSVFELGRVLTDIITNRLYLFGHTTYPSFDAYAEQELGFTGRKGRFHAAIFQAFLAANVDGEVVDRLGSAKARLLARVVTPENAAKWIERAESVPVRDLEDEVKRAQARPDRRIAQSRLGSITIPYEHTETLEAWKEACELASRMTGCESKEAVLECLCGEFLGTYGLDGSHDQDEQSKTLAEYEVLTRDGWRCVVEDCRKRVTLQAHHIELRSRRPDMVDDPANKCVLCLECHEKITLEQAELVQSQGKWALRPKEMAK